MSNLLEQAANPQEPSYRIIQLTKNKVTLVDAGDFEWLTQWNWYAAEYKTRGTTSFYAARRESGPRGTTGILLMHRVIMNPPSVKIIDHHNFDGLDNRRRNLRICTHPQNHQNQRARINSVSGYKGVSFDKSRGKWIVQSKIDGKYVSLGRFDSVLDAARAYDEFAKSHFGEFAFLNFPLNSGASTIDPCTTVPPYRNS